MEVLLQLGLLMATIVSFCVAVGVGVSFLIVLCTKVEDWTDRRKSNKRR